MSFLVTLAVVLMVHQGEWVQHIQRDEWFEAWLDRTTAELQRHRWYPWLLVGVPVSVLVLLVALFERQWWIMLPLNVLVLLYAIGRGNWRTEGDQWVNLFAEKDEQLLKQRLAGESSLVDGADDDLQIENIWLKARSNVLYHQLDGFYTVIFWFFLLGAPMALLYRLLHLYRQMAVSHAGSGRVAVLADVDLLIWLIEWVPVRLMALLFCLVGNFSTGFWVLKQVISDASLSSTDALARCADAALFLDGSVDDNTVEEDARDRTAKMIERLQAQSTEQRTLLVMRRYSVELRALLRRSEWAFLVALALVALL